MSEKDQKNLSKQAYEQAQKELLEDRIKEIKGYILSTLEAIENKKKEKEKVEEELRVLKLDLDDLRNGKFEKIEERLTKSDLARNVSAINIVHINSSGPYLTNFHNVTGSLGIDSTCGTLSTTTEWNTFTAGTYETSDGKMFYL